MVKFYAAEQCVRVCSGDVSFSCSCRGDCEGEFWLTSTVLATAICRRRDGALPSSQRHFPVPGTEDAPSRQRSEDGDEALRPGRARRSRNRHRGRGVSVPRTEEAVGAARRGGSVSAPVRLIRRSLPSPSRRRLSRGRGRRHHDGRRRRGVGTVVGPAASRRGSAMRVPSWKSDRRGGDKNGAAGFGEATKRALQRFRKARRARLSSRRPVAPSKGAAFGPP